MKARKSGSSRVYVHRGLALALLVSLVVGGANLTYGEDEDGIEALNRMGRKFAAIAEQAYAGVAVIKTASRTLPKPLERMYKGGFHFSPDGENEIILPKRPPEPGRIAPSIPHDLAPYVSFSPIQLPLRGQGLGIVVSADGYIITNYHVIDDAEKIEVELADGRSFEGKVIGKDVETDIAVVKIDAENLKALVPADSDQVRPGDWIVAVTNPMGIGRTFDIGLVTGLHRSGFGMAAFEDFIQTSSAPAQGSGGGPLLDLRGRVVGMSAMALGGEHGKGVGLAIPANMAKSVYEQLIETGAVARGFLGVYPADIDAELADALGLETGAGALVTQLNEDSPAGKAGLKRQDIIVEFNGQKISSSKQLRDCVAKAKPNTKAEVIVLRNKERKKFEVTLGERPSAK